MIEEDKVLTPSRIQSWLTRMDIPWDRPKSEVVQQYGHATKPYFRSNEIHILQDRPPLHGLLLGVHCIDHQMCLPHVPIDEFECSVWVGYDPAENFKVACEQIESALVRKPNVSSSISATWQDGPASVQIIKHIPRTTDVSNRYLEIDPRRASAASVQVVSGWRQALSEQEKVWLTTFKPDGYCDFTGSVPRILYGRGPRLEFLRPLPDDYSSIIGRYGLSADGKALIYFSGDLSIIHTAQIDHIRIDYWQSTGRNQYGGCCELSAVCCTGYPEMPMKTLKIVDCYAGMGSLDAIGAGLSQRLAKPLKVLERGWTD